jgi:hypothetical protein
MMAQMRTKLGGLTLQTGGLSRLGRITIYFLLSGPGILLNMAGHP